MDSSKYLSVSALNEYIKQKFDRDPYLNRQVFLTGEISNYRHRPTHQYFSLKDEKTRISVVMFKGAFDKIKFTPEEGMKVLVCGRVSTYPVTGQYQIYIDKMEPDGVGQLYQRYEQLKEQLGQAGYFAKDHKKPLPQFPKRIAVITSPSGAVIEDIIKTVRRRYPIAQIVLFPTVVQGEKAASDIVRQIHRVEAVGNFDTLIVGRGGGSIEDLWPFNDEMVAKAIYKCLIPVISSVGHETDYTIADYVADCRAATPTAAAELSVPKLSDVLLYINDRQNQIMNYFNGLLKNKKQRLQYLEDSYIFRDPSRIYENYVQKVDLATEHLKNLFNKHLNDHHHQLQQLEYRLRNVDPGRNLSNQMNQLNLLNQRLFVSMRNIMQHRSQRLVQLTDSLNHLSPKQIMERGYSYVTKDGQVVNRIDDLKLDDTITLNLFDGQVDVKVSQIRRDDNNGK